MTSPRLSDDTSTSNAVYAGNTVKKLKIRTPEKIAVITLKVEQDGFSLE